MLLLPCLPHDAGLCTLRDYTPKQTFPPQCCFCQGIPSQKQRSERKMVLRVISWARKVRRKWDCFLKRGVAEKVMDGGELCCGHT